ncbi:MAG: hypothetical protein ACI8VE_001053 [Natrialbaceae archaeon]|jgi:hypothetical protein
MNIQSKSVKGFFRVRTAVGDWVDHVTEAAEQASQAVHR